MFSWLDYAVFSATIVLSLAIGVYYAVSGGRQRTTSEYLIADRSFSVIPVSMSMSVSYLSSIAILGNSAEIHYYGATYLFWAIGMGFGMTIAAFTAIPVFYPLELISLNEYLTQRYDSKVVLYLGWLWQVMRQITYNGVVMYGPAAMFEAMAGFPSWASILLIGVAGTVYTTLGGFKAVVWTDVFQSVIIFGGMIVIIIRGLMLAGGISDVLDIYNDGYRLKIGLDPSPLVRQSLWGMLLSGVFGGYISYGVSQSGVQRICALKSMRDAKRAVMLSVLVRVTLECLCSVCGVITFAYYAKRGCDPLKAGLIENPNQILPHFVMDVLGYWGIPGLFVAAVFSGALSTISSNLNGIAAITWDDLLAKRLDHWADWRKALVTKVITLICGIVSLVIGLLATQTSGSINQVSALLGSLSLCPLMVVFVSGALIPRINRKSILVGSLVSMALAGWFSGGAMFFKSHQAGLPTTTLNCTRKDPNAGLSWFTNSTFGSEYVNSDDVITLAPVADDTESSGFATMFAISPYMIAPLVLGFSMLIVLLVSFIPGCHSIGKKKRKQLFYPCIRKLISSGPDVQEEYKMVHTDPERL